MIAKHKVVMSCNNGFIFHQIFKPLIEENWEQWEITLLLKDIYIPDYVIRTINKLLLEKKIIEFHLFPILEKKSTDRRLTLKSFDELKKKSLRIF